MSEPRASMEEHGEPTLYEIRIKGHLDDRWVDTFEGLTLMREDNGVTLLTGPVIDQAALHGVLRAVRNLGVPLLSVTHVQCEKDMVMSTTLTPFTPTSPSETDYPRRSASDTTVDSPERAKRIVAASQRRAEIVIATLFLVTAAASIPGAFVLDRVLNASDYLARVFPDKGAVELGALLWSINNIGIVFIAVFAFGVLRKRDEALAVGYLASRIVEGTIMMVGIAATLLLIPLSQEFLKAGAPHGSWFQSVGDVLKHAKYLGLTGLSLPMLGLGGLLFTWMLFRFRLVPRVISVVGLIGYALVLLGSMAAWFDLLDASPGGNATILALPVAVFEIILLPFWLFFKGFKTPEAPQRILDAA